MNLLYSQKFSFEPVLNSHEVLFKNKNYRKNIKLNYGLIIFQ